MFDTGFCVGLHMEYMDDLNNTTTICGISICPSISLQPAMVRDDQEISLRYLAAAAQRQRG